MKNRPDNRAAIAPPRPFPSPQELRRALEKNEFVIYYQPVVDLTAGGTAGYEALLRWRHPERGLVLPGDFIPAAEETGLIVPIGAWVLEEAARQVALWREQPGQRRDLFVSVNLSPRQLADPDALVETVAQVLADNRLQPENIKLEITEGARIAVDAAKPALRKLSALGVRLALDDFGVGFSCLGYLKQFPISCIKIDRLFLENLDGSHRDEQLLRAIVQLAKTLDLRVALEGVETEEQAAWVEELACCGQGYHYARPLPPEQIRLNGRRGQESSGDNGAV